MSDFNYLLKLSTVPKPKGNYPAGAVLCGSFTIA